MAALGKDLSGVTWNWQVDLMKIATSLPGLALKWLVILQCGIRLQLYRK
jgi:hypothetical protein